MPPTCTVSGVNATMQMADTQVSKAAYERQYA